MQPIAYRIDSTLRLHGFTQYNDFVNLCDSPA